MSILTLDFETHYSSEYSLSSLTTEEYIRDPQFEVIGFSIKVDNQPAEWYSGLKPLIKKALDKYDWNNSCLVGHNLLFDGAILAWHFQIYPAFYADTLSMARANNGPDAGGSLASLVQRYKIGIKGDEVVNAKGKRLKDFNPHQLQAYAEYCLNDTELTYKLFKELVSDFPESELKLIDQTLRMFIKPSLVLNTELLTNRLAEVKQEKSDLLRGLMVALKCDTEEEVRKKLASSIQFEKILTAFNIPIPRKLNSKGVEIPAFAKTDLEFLALEEHEDPMVQQLCSARLGTKSTIEETRIQRFLDIARRNHGYLPVPLKYYGAHTGRWSGMDYVNLQNLPSRDAKKKALKSSICVLPGNILLNADLSQIEARILAWLAGQDDLIEAFMEKKDVYSEFASFVYNKRVTRESDPEARFLGKTCILGLGFGTGPSKLQRTLETGQIPIKLDWAKCNEIVRLYRYKYEKIPELWRQADNALVSLMAWPAEANTFYLGKHEVLPVTPYGIHLPNNMWIRYSNLRRGAQNAIMYDSRKGPVNIFGSAAVENVVQALARIIIGGYLIQVSERYTVSLTVHDSLVVTVKETEVEEAKLWISKIMSIPPDWAEGLPIEVEIKTGKNYGEI